MQQSLIDSFAMSAQWTIGAFVDDIIRSDGVVDAARRDCDLLLDVDKSLESRKIRRPLHRIVRTAHCRHCNSAACLQYENCPLEHATSNFDDSHTEDSILDEQPHPIGSSKRIDSEHSYSRRRLYKTSTGPIRCFSAYCLANSAEETNDASSTIASIDALRHGRRAAVEENEEDVGLPRVSGLPGSAH